MSRSNVKVLLTVACAAALAPFAVAGAADRPAVVAVRVDGASGVPERATGTVIAPGSVLTVAHVLEGGRRVSVAGRPAKAVWRRPESDLALLRAPGVSGPHVRFGTAGEDLRVLLVDGPRAAGLRRRVRARLVDQPGRPRRPSLELGVPVAAGDSGAPVVTPRGEIVGVVFARSTRSPGRAYAVRVDRRAANGGR